VPGDITERNHRGGKGEDQKLSIGQVLFDEAMIYGKRAFAARPDSINLMTIGSHAHTHWSSAVRECACIALRPSPTIRSVPSTA